MAAIVGRELQTLNVAAAITGAELALLLQNGSSVQSALNAVLGATVAIGDNPPATTWAMRIWIDTSDPTDPKVNVRNAANNGWITIPNGDFLPAQISAAEIAAGDEVSLRSVAPADLVAMIDAHGVQLPAQISAPEIAAGIEPALRSVSPADLLAFIDTHAWHDGTALFPFTGELRPGNEDLGAGAAVGAAVALSLTGVPIKRMLVDGTAPTVTVSGGTAGGSFELRITQGATPQAVAWAGVDIWTGKAVPALGSAAGDRDTVTFVVHHDGIVEGTHVGTAGAAA